MNTANVPIHDPMICITSPAVHATVTLRDGKSYYVVLCDGAYALVQPEGCSGWAQVWFDDLDDVTDTNNVEEVVAAAINKTIGSTR